jgi:hypothetical protein
MTLRHDNPSPVWGENASVTQAFFTVFGDPILLYMGTGEEKGGQLKKNIAPG